MSETGTQIKNIETLIRSRYPVIYVVSPEEERVVAAAVQIGRRLGRTVYHWSCLSGLRPYPEAATAAEDAPDDPATADPAAALMEAGRVGERSVLIFKDFHPYLAQNDPAIIRLLKEAARSFPPALKTIILTGPYLSLPPELEKDVTVVDFPLPGAEEFGAILDGVAARAAANPKLSVDLSDSTREEIIKALSGLTLSEARNAVTKYLTVGGRLGPEQVPEIIREKSGIIRKSGYLEYYEPEMGMEDVGGLENLKRWLGKRKEAFSDRARAFGLPAPRGVLLLGVQGCGKSICVKAISAMWGLPLLRMDIGRIFDAKVGGSEDNIRRAIAIAERVAPCILWVDEIDKAFGGQAGEASDGGTAKRVLATFLTWMGEKTSSVFVAATANNIASLPSELLRKGRFDEIFFVDIPNELERRNILAIHLRRRGRDPENFDLSAMAHAMEGFSGAEIEQAVISGLFSAFDDEARDLTDWDITMAAAETVPLARTMREEIDALRQWCHTRTRPASESSRLQTSRLARPTSGGV